MGEGPGKTLFPDEIDEPVKLDNWEVTVFKNRVYLLKICGQSSAKASNLFTVFQFRK
jgi:hypothetical protein